MERLQKVMAEAGIASRRTCEEIIADGRVTVNGKVVVKLPCMVDKFKDRIIVDERKLRFEKKVYYLLNKPKKVICTNHDPDNRRRTIDLLKDVKERVYPVGRLDSDSQGLVVMTNDGDLANELTHPRYGVPKTYIAEISADIDSSDIDKLKRGFFISRCGRASMDSVKVLKRDRKHSLLEITLREGRNRQIRRMLLRLGYNVTKLTRVTFGPLTLRGCGIGKHRELKPVEVEELKKSVEIYKKIAKADAAKKPKIVKSKTAKPATESETVVKPVKKTVEPVVRVAKRTVYGNQSSPGTTTKKTERKISPKPVTKSSKRITSKPVIGKSSAKRTAIKSTKTSSARPKVNKNSRPKKR